MRRKNTRVKSESSATWHHSEFFGLDKENGVGIYIRRHGSANLPLETRVYCAEGMESKAFLQPGDTAEV